MERLMQVLAFKTARLKHKRIFSNEFKISYYMWQAAWSDISKIIIVLALSLVLQIFWETIIIILTFGGLRYFSGGYHAKSYNSCFIMTTGMFIGTALLSKILLHYYNVEYDILTIITAVMMYIMIKLAPQFEVDIDKKIKCEYKFNSVYYVIYFFILVLALNNYFRTTMYIGIITQSIMVVLQYYKKKKQKEM